MAEERNVLPAWVRIINVISKAAAVIASSALIAIVVTVLIDVIGRYLFNTPLRGGMEIVQYWWMPLTTVLGFAYTQYMQQNIEATIVVENLAHRLMNFAGRVATGISLVAVVMLTYYAGIEALKATSIRQIASGNAPIPTWPIYILVTIGLAVLVLQIAASLHPRVPVQFTADVEEEIQELDEQLLEEK